jgi:hypothetical protein
LSNHHRHSNYRLLPRDPEELLLLLEPLLRDPELALEPLLDPELPE